MPMFNYIWGHTWSLPLSHSSSKNKSQRQCPASNIIQAGPAHAAGQSVGGASENGRPASPI